MQHRAKFGRVSACLTFFVCFLSAVSGAVAATAPAGAGAQPGAFTADGKRLTGFHSLPDATRVTVNGRPTTAGAIRARLRVLAFRNLGPAKTVIGGGKAGLRTTTALVAEQAIDIPEPAPEAGASRRGFVKPDPDYCAKHAPLILHAKGSITPLGYVVITGICFGGTGTVRLAGTFPGGSLLLHTQSWDSTSITATLPAVTGVYDQVVTLQVVAERQVANPVNMQFTATREIAVLPAHFITNVQCSMGNATGDNQTSSCDAAAGSHWQGDSGTDTWQAQIPQGFVLTSLVLSTGYGSVPGTAGFDDAPPAAERWSVSWQSSVIGTYEQDSTDWGIFITSTSVDIYASSYTMTVYASGPAGTMPQ